MLKQLREHSKQKKSKASSVCSNCNGLGYTIENGYQLLCKCEDTSKGNFITNIKGPLGIDNFRTDIYEDQEKANNLKNIALRYIQNYPKLKSKGLYFHGTVGSGKTYLSAIIISEITKKYKITGKQVTTGEIKREIQATFSNNGVTGEEIIQKYAKYPILLIDDIGTEANTEWSEEILFGLLNERAINNTTTFFTSNISPENLHYHDRMISRINSMSLSLKFIDEDIRATQSSEKDLEMLNTLLGGVLDDE